MANPLADCVSSLRSSNHLLGNSISILDSGVNDFPRLAKVLQTTKHFELLPSSALSAAQSQLLSSLVPEFDSLLSRIETHLDRLRRREQALIARCELLDGRLSLSGEDGEAIREDGGLGRKSLAGEGDGSRDALKLKQLKAKKERLGYTVERLGLQAQQKERQLRLSVAAQ
ncbi:MAG: hypothetical protein Q9209_002741 [Squamulea sp. 1 TL-2023]